MNPSKILNFFFELGTMRNIVRSHSQFIAQANDSLSDHSYRVTIIGMVLAKSEGADVNKVMKMCLFHDLAEVRTGDANYINAQYTRRDEIAAITDQLTDIPNGEEILPLYQEFERGESNEAIVTKDADVLDQIILQREYFGADEKNHTIWYGHQLKRLQTDSAKKLAAEVKDANPFEWLYQAAEDKTGKKLER